MSKKWTFQSQIYIVHASISLIYIMENRHLEHPHIEKPNIKLPLFFLKSEHYGAQYIIQAFIPLFFIMENGHLESLSFWKMQH